MASTLNRCGAVLFLIQFHIFYIWTGGYNVAKSKVASVTSRRTWQSRVVPELT